MGLRQDCYAKVWTVKQYGKVYSGRVTVDKREGETYEKLFDSYVTFGGDAAEKAKNLGLPEVSDFKNPIFRRIHLISSPDITAKYVGKEKAERLKRLANGNEELTNFITSNLTSKYITIWDFEVAEGKPKDDVDDEDDDLPFN